MIKYLSICCLLIFSALSSQAQDQLAPVQWSIEAKGKGNSVFDVMAHAKIDEGWKVYALNLIIPEDKVGPVPTSFVIEATDAVTLEGEATEIIKADGPHFEPLFEIDLLWYKKAASFAQRVSLKSKDATVKGYVEYMACDNAQCIFPAPFEFNLSLSDGKLKSN